MGVQRLQMLLQSHPRVCRDVRLRNSRLVIDGCNLLYLLYFHSDLDQNHGGEYAAFEDLIETFIRNLRACRIQPYVLLDGGGDPTDKKFQTTMSRLRDRIQKANRAASEGVRMDVLPLLAKGVFKQTLARLEVPVAQCYGEADPEIAALASEWNCPVLSSDSDFYIFSLPAGLLPLADFKWEEVQRSGAQSFIPCKSYSTSSFCIYFQIQPHLLPAFAALAGNDYVKLQFHWDRFAPESGETTRHLEGLLRWLGHFQRPRQAFEAALGLLGELSQTEKDKLMRDLLLGMEEYQFPHSSLKRFFIHGTAPPKPSGNQWGRVPDWAQLPLTQGRLSPVVLDLLLLRRMSLSFPVEPASMACAHLTARPLRQLLYGLLLGEGQEVSENDRDGFQVKLVPVQSAVTAASKTLELDSLNQAEPALRLQVLLEALEVTEASLRRLPPQLRLPVAVTCYWLRRAQPRPDEVLLKALLLGLSTGEPLRHRADLQIKNHPPREKLDVAVAHAFNQWQCCLRASLHLNLLLGCPLPEPQLSRLYEGTLVHQLVFRMRSVRKTRLFPKNDRPSLNRYNLMQAVVHRIHSRDPPPAPPEAKQAQQQRQPLDDVTLGLQQLFLLDEEAEARSMARAQEEQRLDDLLLLKTRFKAKDRRNRCSNPELARKEERRGGDLL